MKHSVSTEIRARYFARDGWHVFTCEELPGLFVASMDRKLAFSDLPDAIRMLLKLDFKRDYVISHKLTYDEFVQRNWLSQRAQSAVNSRTEHLVNEGANSISFILEPSRESAMAHR